MGKTKQFGKSKAVRWTIFGVAAAVVVALIVFSKPKEKKKLADLDFDPETTPTMFTDSVETFISDSGYVRYKIEADVWYVFDEAERPNWKFNRGLYLEQYNDSMEIVSTFICDSAIYLSDDKLWEFIGNVRMRNETGDRFLTEQMFWDTRAHKIYSDSFIHIERSDRIIEGFGFETDEKISDYIVRRPTMIIPVSDFNRSRDSEPDSEAPPSDDENGEPMQATDTLEAAETPAPSRRPSPVRTSERRPYHRQTMR